MEKKCSGLMDIRCVKTEVGLQMCWKKDHRESEVKASTELYKFGKKALQAEGGTPGMKLEAAV